MAKEQPKVWVGSQHIEQGIRRSRTLCPVALAINEKGLGPATVGVDYIETQGKRIRTPPSVVNAIMALDCGKPVKPFGFEWPEKQNT